MRATREDRLGRLTAGLERLAPRGWPGRRPDWRRVAWSMLALAWLTAAGQHHACGQALVDLPRDLQLRAVAEGRAEFGRWGPEPGKYISWSSHSLRIIPVYTFGTRQAGSGIDLDDYQGKASGYRTTEGLQRLYGQVPPETLNPDAEYLDQTDIARLQRAALKAGKKHIVLVVFDGMDWQTTWAAATWKTGKVAYREGPAEAGTLAFLDYTSRKSA
ncbi:MAG: hypothetical protein ACKO3P_16345, partial [Planctomycetaceae bacterium]